MNKNILTGLKLIFCTAILATVFFAADALADAGDGQGPSGGSCRFGPDGIIKADTCRGVTWVLYEFTGNTDTSVPTMSGITSANIPAGTCGKYNHFYNLGFEGYIMTKKEQPELDQFPGYQYGTVPLSMTAGYGGGANYFNFAGAGLAPRTVTTNGAARAKKYVTSEQAKIVFNRLPEKEKRGFTFTPGSGLGWFCGPADEDDDPLPEPPAPQVISSCPLPNSNYSIEKGGTQAASAVRNLTAGNVWQQTTESQHLSVVWAKPGDSVQFKHTLCYGAQAVRGTHDVGYTVPRNQGHPPSSSNQATITAFTTPGTPDANYLFGKTLTGNSSQSITLPRGVARPSQVSSADELGDYHFTYYSPSQFGKAAGATYRCYSGTAAFPPFLNNGYQIPDFTPETKPADCRAVAPSDVGKVIQQNLNWTDVKAWTSEYSSGGYTDCGCDRSRVSDPSYYPATYDYTPPGSPGHHVLKCIKSNEKCGSWCCRHEFNYGGTGWGDCTRYCNKYTYKKKDYWYYPIQSSAAGGPTKQAQVKIPYNYKTKTNVTVSSHPGGVVFGGEDTHITSSVDTETRGDNPDVPGDYATITKPSKYEVVTFTIPSTVSYASAKPKIDGDEDRPGSISDRVCNFYNVFGGKCQTIRSEMNVELNKIGSLRGSNDQLVNLKMNIPDIDVGWKYCIALGVFPSNSHDTLNAPASNDPALTTEGKSWNYSKAICVTIAKKPTVHMHNSGTITSGGITTSIAKKNINSKDRYDSAPRNNYNACRFSDISSATGDCTASDNHKSRRVFGSWTEYDTVAKGKIQSFASGAAYGYERNNGGSYATPGGYDSVNYNNDPDPCVYSSQSLNNDQCASRTIGLSAINPSDVVLSRVLSRYSTATTQGIVTQTGPELDLNGTCLQNFSGGYRPSIDNAKFSCLPNGVKYIKVQASANISGPTFCIPSSNNVHDNPTTVIDVDGTLTISTNIKYGKIERGKCVDETYTDIARIPQLLIFAKDIAIRNTATNIDAWLIAGQGSGKINTCSDVTGLYFLSDQVCNYQLTINGPIFAGSVTLNRTHGAGPGRITSILPAEIFNLRNDVYLWSFAQAQRFSQAVTVYSRELAPRY